MINATPFIPPIQRVPAEALIEIPGIEQQPENRTASICKSSIWQLLKASTITTITATACSFIHQQTTQSTESPIETATQMGNLTPTMINSACYSGGCYVSSIFVGMIADSSLTKYHKTLPDIVPEIIEKRNQLITTAALVFLGICLGTPTVYYPVTITAMIVSIVSGSTTTTDIFQKIPTPPQKISSYEIESPILLAQITHHNTHHQQKKTPL